MTPRRRPMGTGRIQGSYRSCGASVKYSAEHPADQLERDSPADPPGQSPFDRRSGDRSVHGPWASGPSDAQSHADHPRYGVIRAWPYLRIVGLAMVKRRLPT
jgi:hypothetical protein